MVAEHQRSAEEATTARVGSRTVARAMAGACEELKEYDEDEQTSWETEMEDDGHVDHVGIVELEMHEMINETDADWHGTKDLLEFLPSTVGKVKDIGTEEDLVEMIKVIYQDENKTTIKNLIVSSDTSFEDVHESFEASRGNSSSVGFLMAKIIDLLQCDRQFEVAMMGVWGEENIRDHETGHMTRET